VRITLPNTYNLGQEFFRWEIATAVAGSIIGINAFNQPDVEASKIETKKLTSQYETTGSLPPESPFFEEKGIKLFADEKNAAALKGGTKLVDVLKTHLSRLGSGDYFAVLGYITMNPANEKTLQTIRHAVRDKKKVATVLGFGPRFLHSTGQATKAGPIPAFFCRSPATTPRIFPCPGRNTPSDRESRASPRRLRGTCRTQPPRIARPPGEESKVRARDAHESRAKGNRVNH